MTTEMHKAPSVAHNTGTSGDNATSVARCELSTSEGGRRYVADFFTRELRRHDFARYITTTLAADFACVLAKHLAATGKQQAGEEVSVEEDVYYSIADMIEPYVQREGTNPDGPLPASVHDSVQIIFDHWLKTRAQVGEVQGDALAMIGSNLRSILDLASKMAGGAYQITVANIQHETNHALQLLEAALAARQPGAQEPVDDECRCENGGVRYSAEGCTCLKCGKHPEWHMGGRRVRITERRRTNYHPDPNTFEAVCTWHMGGDIEFRKDGETNTRRVNDYRQNLGSVEVIR